MISSINTDHYLNIVCHCKTNNEWAIKNRQTRETGYIGYTRQNKHTTQYVLDTTMHKQTQIT